MYQLSFPFHAAVRLVSHKHIVFISFNAPQVRYAHSKFGKKIKMAHQQALVGHQEYLKRLKHPTEAHEVDPALLTFSDRAKLLFSDKSKASEKNKKNLSSVHIPDYDELLAPVFKGHIASHVWPKFGKMSVFHGNIFDFTTDMVIIPTTPNMLPYSGLGLEVLERGGPKFINNMLLTVKNMYSTNTTSTSNQSRLVQTNRNSFNTAKEDTAKIQPGNVIILPAHAVTKKAQMIALVVLPYIYEKSPLESAQLLRRSIRSMFDKINLYPLPSTNTLKKTIALPLLGSGIHGFQPSNVAEILLDEALEVLMQLNSRDPSYNITNVSFVGAKMLEAKTLGHSLNKLAQQWLPNCQVITADEYNKERERRILKIPYYHYSQFLSREKYYYRQGQKKINKKRQLRCQTSYGFRWRKFVERPSSLLVYKKTGLPIGPNLPTKTVMIDRSVQKHGFKKLRVSRGALIGDSRPVQIHKQCAGLL